MPRRDQLPSRRTVKRCHRRRQKPRRRQAEFPSKHVPVRASLIKRTRNHQRTPKVSQTILPSWGPGFLGLFINHRGNVRTVRIGFNLNASRNEWVTPVGVGRIQDKTRWTKALGEAGTVVYGDWTEGSEPNKHRSAGDRVTSVPHWSGPVRSIGQHDRCESGRRRGKTMTPGAPMRWLWHRSGKTRGCWFV